MRRNRFSRKAGWRPQFVVHSVDQETAERVRQAAAEAAETARTRQPKRRAPRAGQQPPRRRDEIPDEVLDYSSADPSDAGGSDPDLPESGSEDDGGGSSSQRRCSFRDAKTYTEKLHERHEAWELDCPEKTEKLRAAAARQEESVAIQRESIRSCMESCIDRALGSHACCQHAHAKLVTLSRRGVTYLQMGYAVVIEVPTVHCSLCHDKWEVSACDVGCFPSTPVVVEFWVDVQLLELFHQCAIKGGISMNVFAAATANVRAATDAPAAWPFSARYVCKLRKKKSIGNPICTCSADLRVCKYACAFL